MTGGFRRLRILETTIEPVAGGTWYRIGLVLQGPGLPAASCSADLAAAASDTATGHDPAPTASVTSTISEDGYVVGILVAENGNTPDSTGMGTPSGYTNLDARDYSRATWFIGYKAVSAGTAAMSASFTPGFGGGDRWIGAQAWLPWESLTVVQDASIETNTGGGATVILSSTPTPGNTILMLGVSGSSSAMTVSGTGGGPTTGWTELFAESVDTELGVACWARCVESGDGAIYGWTGGAGILMADFGYVVEIAT